MPQLGSLDFKDNLLMTGRKRLSRLGSSDLLTKPRPGLRTEGEEKSWEREEISQAGAAKVAGHQGSRIQAQGMCLSGLESGASKGRQTQERTFCVVPFMSSSRTGNTNLRGQKSDESWACSMSCPE